MDTNRKTAIIVGVLFIIATLFLFVGEAIYGPVLLSPDYLENAYSNRTIAILGILLEFAWPVLPNGNVGRSRATYRGMVSGVLTNDPPGSDFHYLLP